MLIKILSFNCYGMGAESKQNHARGLIKTERACVFGIQETKMETIGYVKVISMWGNYNIDYLVGSAIGSSGGTLLVWDPLIFSKEEVIPGSHFTSIIGKWIGINEMVGLINIYGP